jgi:signal transduction histidine kinase
MIAQPLTKVLLKRFLLAYVLFAIGLSSILFYAEYHNSRESTLQVLNELSDTFTPSAAGALWGYQEDLLKAVTRGIGNHPQVASVIIFGTDGEKWSEWQVAEGYEADPELSVSRELLRPGRTIEGPSLGRLVIASSREQAEAQLMNSLVKVGLSIVFLLFFLLLTLWLLVNKLLGRPLTAFSNQVASLTRKQPYRHIELGNLSVSEIATLQQGFNRLMDEVSIYNDEMEQKVEERTFELNESEKKLQQKSIQLESLNQNLEKIVEDRSIKLRKNQDALIKLVQSPIFTSTSLKGVCSYVTKYLADHLDIARVSIWKRTHENKAITCIDLFEKTSGLHSEGLELFASDFPAYFKALDSNDIIAAEDAFTHPATFQFTEAYLKPLGIVSMLDVSIYVEGKSWGVICCEHVEMNQREFEAEEITYVTTVGSLVALALQAEQHRTTLKQLEESKRIAESANQAKTRFLANMSHELRTPMHAILSFSHLANKRVEDDKVKNYLGKIKESGNRLTNLINALLDISKLESGKMEFNFQVTDMVIIVSRSIAELASVSADKYITIKFENSSPVEVELDSGLITQVVINLLSNAIKFSPEGSDITVQIIDVEAVPETGFYGTIELIVKDHGIGIPQDELSKVFDRFFQSSKTVSQAGGTGLGLPICREIISGHKGVIWAESPVDESGNGSCFHFILPKKHI